MHLVTSMPRFKRLAALLSLVTPPVLVAAVRGALAETNRVEQEYRHKPGLWNLVLADTKIYFAPLTGGYKGIRDEYRRRLGRAR